MSNLVNDFEVRKETLRALGGNPDGLANIYEVDLEILKLIGSSEQGIPDAPIDGVQYARQNGEWTPVQIPTVEKYVTITADKSTPYDTVVLPTFYGSLTPPNLQYRINNGNWNDYVFGQTGDIYVASGDFVQFKGVNENGLSMDYDNYLNFSISDLCHLSGNVMSLIDGVGETTVIPNRLCFYRLFKGSSIKTVSSDFLPATTLQQECYRDVFSGCMSLTQAPELPATTLANLCYSGMFYYCTSLTNTPELPAKVLVEGCYQSMFKYCNALNYVKCFAESGISSSSLDNWLEGVSSTGTFEKPDGVVYGTGSSGIPEGWTIKESDMIEAPKDGNQYARQDGAWVEVSKVKTTNNTTMQFWSGTQEEYDAIATKDANTLYVIS